MGKFLSKNEELERIHFNSIAKEYEKNYGYEDEFTKYKINKKVDRFLKSLDLFNCNKNSKVLEIGCGTGTYTIEYSKRIKNLKVLATDISEEMINLSSKNKKMPTNVKFKVASAYNTMLKSRSVDVVCGFYILHHIDQKKVKKEILRVLKKGGMVYFYEPNILNPIVFAIKSSRFIKKIIGDSSDEWAINPIKVASQWKEFKVVYNRTSEFVWPLSFVPYKVKVVLDKISDAILSKLPLLNLIGGSVETCLIKK